MLHRNIVIVGGGPVGLSMALFLARQQKKVTIIDQGLDYTQDRRVLALSFASREILEQLNSWNASRVTPIQRVQISHAGLGISNIDATDLGLHELGYTVSYADICEKLMANVEANPLIELIIAKVDRVNELTGYSHLAFTCRGGASHEITAGFLIMAEGGKLLQLHKTKINHDYRQKAVVARIKLKNPQKYIAYERFTEIGPLVLLPFENSHVIVWALDNALADEIITNADKLAGLLDTHYTSRFGGVEICGKPNTYPLRLIQIRKRGSKRMVMIGNSAQTVHPVSAQGLNLGLRDVMILDSLIAKVDNISDCDLTEFDRLRNNDADHVIGFTHFLATFTHAKNGVLKHARGAGLMMLGNLPFLQNSIARRLIYGSR